MGKLLEIWKILKRRDYKDGDEVHLLPMDGGFMVSDKLYKQLEPKLEELPKQSYLGDLYGVKVLSTPYLPYIYRKAKKRAKKLRVYK